MYLHIGQNVVVPEADIIGIFDLDNTTGSFITRNFLGAAEKAGCVINVSDELPRSFVVSDTGNRLNVYLSQLSPQTLSNRAKRGSRTGLIEYDREIES